MIDMDRGQSDLEKFKAATAWMSDNNSTSTRTVFGDRGGQRQVRKVMTYMDHMKTTKRKQIGTETEMSLASSED